MDTKGQALRQTIRRLMGFQPTRPDPIAPRYEPTSNVSQPLTNTRRDGQWDYRPVKKRIDIDTKSK